MGGAVGIDQLQHASGEYQKCVGVADAGAVFGYQLAVTVHDTKTAVFSGQNETGYRVGIETVGVLHRRRGEGTGGHSLPHGSQFIGSLYVPDVRCLLSAHRYRRSGQAKNTRQGDHRREERPSHTGRPASSPSSATRGRNTASVSMWAVCGKKSITVSDSTTYPSLSAAMSRESAAESQLR
jgi:hypothetical protein